MRGSAWTAPACCLPLLFCAACFGTPSPLTPAFEGSVGVPHHGVLTNAVELPVEGTGFVRYRRNGPNHWGNPRLVRALESVARAVHDKMPGGPPLVIGDLSARNGGKIPRHQSHRTGRDVDLPWFVMTPEGIPLQNPGFVNVGPDMLAGGLSGGAYLRIDVAREWQLVKELILSPDVDVQWMFCSHDVEALLIDYARAKGEPMDLVWHAETVLMEPGDSLSHDDHIHLRIACTPEEAVFGCEGGGPRWDWLPSLPELPIAEEALYQAVEDVPVLVTTEEPRGEPPG